MFSALILTSFLIQKSKHKETKLNNFPFNLEKIPSTSKKYSYLPLHIVACCLVTDVQWKILESGELHCTELNFIKSSTQYSSDETCIIS